MVWRWRRERGFTLIELMMVVAIVGILAVLAVYGVRKYLANAKTAEARNALGQIARDAATAYEKESMPGLTLSQGSAAALSRRLCGSATKSVPSTTGSIKGAKYQSSVAEWNVDAAGNSGFACLKFVIDQPQYYLYQYTAFGSSAAGASFTGTANGDLNGDGNTSAFSITGGINTSFALNLAPNISESSPEE